MNNFTVFFPVPAAAQENPREKHVSGKKSNTTDTCVPESQLLLEVCVRVCVCVKVH